MPTGNAGDALHTGVFTWRVSMACGLALHVRKKEQARAAQRSIDVSVTRLKICSATARFYE